MDRSLSSLSSEFYPRAVEWIGRVIARGVPIMIVQTGRTLEEHRANLLAGTSGTTMSLHLPRRLRWPSTAGPLDPAEADRVDAMDVAPYAVYLAKGPNKILWDASAREWGVIAEECERVGLRSGARWRKPFDPGHGELAVPWKAHYLAEERARPWPVFV